MQAGWCLAGKQLCSKGPGASGGHQVEGEPAKCPCGIGGQQLPGCTRESVNSRSEEVGESPPLLEHLWSGVSRSGVPRTRETWTCWSKSSKGPL